MTTIHIAGENIRAGSDVVISHDAKVYAVTAPGVLPRRRGAPIGKAEENIREGMRVRVDNARIREDGA